MGTLPIAIGFGAGSESRRPLGLAVVGGLLFSQFFTLFVTPVFYVYMDRLQALTSRSAAIGPARYAGGRAPVEVQMAATGSSIAPPAAR